MRFLIPIVLLLLGTGGGVGAGLILVADGGSGTSNVDGSSDPIPASDDHGSANDGEAPAGATEFVRLNNQFVVPIVRSGAVRSLVVMAITLEVMAGDNTQVFDREPRLRDAFLQAMFAHANAGGFDGHFTEAHALTPLRTALNEAAASILGETVQDVLIVDITRQDA